MARNDIDDDNDNGTNNNNVDNDKENLPFWLNDSFNYRSFIDSTEVKQWFYCNQCIVKWFICIHSYWSKNGLAKHIQIASFDLCTIDMCAWCTQFQSSHSYRYFGRYSANVGETEKNHAYRTCSHCTLLFLVSMYAKWRQCLLRFCFVCCLPLVTF